MRTIYEITPTQVFAAPTKTGYVLNIEEGVGTTIKVDLSAERALSLKRNLARLVDPDVADPQGYSIRDLVTLRKELGTPEMLPTAVWVDEMVNIINAYIALIEKTQEGAE